MLTRTEIMLQTAQAELAADAENLLEKFATFENSYPQIWESINQILYAQTDMNLADLINLLQIFSEITG
jgi:hypothetical protein